MFRWPVAAMRRLLYTQQGEKHLKHTIPLNSHNLPEKQSVLRPLRAGGNGGPEQHTSRRWRGKDPAWSGPLGSLSPS